MPRTILVIDDEPEKAEQLVRVLRHEGYIVAFLDSGSKALEYLSAQRPDLLICDLEMPDYSGYQIMEAAATYLNMGELPIMLAHEEWTMENWSRSAGGRTADCHFAKPYVISDIIRFIRRICVSLDLYEAANQPAAQI